MGHRTIENCIRPSAAYQDSFRDARIEDTAISGERAAARFSNGEAIELAQDVSERDGVWWWISEVGGNAGRKLFE